MYHTPLCGYAFSLKKTSQHNPAGASVRPQCAIASPTHLSFQALYSLWNYCSPKFPPPSTRLPFHSPRGARLVSWWPCLCRIAVAVVVVCVEPRGPVSPIGVLDIQMTAVMRRKFGTAEPRNRPHRRSSLGEGERTAWAMSTLCHRGPCSFPLLFRQSQFIRKQEI